MKIVLICPTWTDDLGVFAKIAKKRNSQPPLGILYLAAVAESRGHTARVIDADVEDCSIDDIVNEIFSAGFDIVGITATSPIFHKAVALAGELKKRDYKGKIVVGGEHFNIFKKEAFFDCFDFGFFGESDFTFNKFLENIENGKELYKDLKGFVYRDADKIVETEPSLRINELDALKFPAMHLLKLKKYVMTFAKYKKRNYIPILASRGCPFKCVYCSEPLTNPNIRFRSPENVVDEMEKWQKELSNSHFFFVDSNLTLRRSLIEGICNEIIRRGMKITFEGFTRANLVDKDILSLMKKAGLIRLSYGIESGDPEILKIIKKEVAREDMLNAFKITDELGIEAACSVMLGLPGDTRASVERTIEFVKNIPQILYSNFSIANPYPGTEMHEWAKEGKYGLRIKIEGFSDYRRYDHSPIEVNDLSQDDLVKLQKSGLFRIHFTPKRIFAAVKMVGLFELLPVVISLFAKRK